MGYLIWNPNVKPLHVRSSQGLGCGAHTPQLGVIAVAVDTHLIWASTLGLEPDDWHLTRNEHIARPCALTLLC